MTTQIIGFATEYYTLWETRTETIYFTDSYGKHHASGQKVINTFIKNVSTDLNKVHALHPGIEIDENLKGQSRSFEYVKAVDLCPEIFKFGKYSGKAVSEVVTSDFNYILWVADNLRNCTVDYIKTLPAYISYTEAKAKQIADIMANFPVVASGVQEITFQNNPNNQYYNEETEEHENYYAVASIGEGHKLIVLFDQVKHVTGMYDYNMAIINGKAVKTKNKAFKLNLEIVSTVTTERGVQQVAIIK